MISLAFLYSDKLHGVRLPY